MKNLIFSVLLSFLSFVSFSQKYLISVSSFEFSTMVGNKSYSELIFKSLGKVKIETNEKFIVDFKKLKIALMCFFCFEKLA